MKYGWREVIDLSIYNNKGSFIPKLDTLKNSYMGIKMDRELQKCQMHLHMNKRKAFMTILQER